MSATLLEVTRAYHEQVERLERTIVEDLQNDPTCNRDRLHQSHRVRSMIDQISATTYKLIEIYQDDDNARKDEIAALECQMDNEHNLFYDLLKEIREYHRRHHRVVDHATDEVEPMLERAERLFLTKDTPLKKLDKKHFPKGEQINYWKEIALMEAKMEKLCDLLHKTIVRTKENVEKKQAMTYREMEVEREEDDEVQADDDDDDEQQIFNNPLKLPMGWDGKPIPYWLYKLHGLGQEFKCEICGNQSYRGRRAYERHFKEWRHQQGMRCLGIPNTRNFNEITSIEEAKELWDRIQERQEVNKWRPDLEEEYEDQEGNIYSKKTYTDLQRQGLI
ncbi:hypothetical protein ACET3Z_009144 [Daucus carota]